MVELSTLGTFQTVLGISVFSAEYEGHCQVLSLAGYGVFLLHSGQEFRIFNKICSVIFTDQSN